MLLEKVWDYHFDPQTNVIEVDISRLRSKIDKGFKRALLLGGPPSRSLFVPRRGAGPSHQSHGSRRSRPRSGSPVSPAAPPPGWQPARPRRGRPKGLIGHGVAQAAATDEDAARQSQGRVDRAGLLSQAAALP
jgi:hypothetical protein